MNEWLKANLLGMLVGLGALVGVYTAMSSDIRTSALQVDYLEMRVSAAESRLVDHAARLTNGEVVDEKQSVLLESIAKIVERNSDKLETRM